MIDWSIAKQKNESEYITQTQTKAALNTRIKQVCSFGDSSKETMLQQTLLQRAHIHMLDIANNQQRLLMNPILTPLES